MTKTIRKSIKGLAIFIALFCFTTINSFSQSLTKPIEYFGFEPGADGLLFGYEKMIDYFKLLEKQSGRIKTVNIGTSAFGRPLYMVCISSEENISKLEELKEINKELALNYQLSKDQVDIYKKTGKAFVLGTLSMHSNEVAPSQSSPSIAYLLASAKGVDTLEWLNNVVYMMIPNHNPDGMNMVQDHYMKTKGTKYEGTNLPGVYHKYSGHNINRDFVLLTQPENKAISSLTSSEWFPQVMVEKHQMGSTGVRYFVPPNHDPIAQNIDETLWSWIGIFGANMLNDMTALGQTGIAQRYLFDNYWPGSTETCLWKNVISFLTEAASVKTATPIFVEKNELKVTGKGLSEYKKGANLIVPWEGGWWRLGDLVAYEISSTFSIIRTASVNKERILQYRNDICKKEYLKGLNQPPFYYILPSNQNDRGELVRLVDLLKEHGIVVSQLQKDVTIDNRVYRKDDIVVSLAQPFRAFVKEVLETQNYPERRYMPGGEIIKPYDITSWSLPLTMGVESFEINTKSKELEKNIQVIEKFDFLTDQKLDENYMVFLAGNNESYRAAFEVMNKNGKVYRIVDEIIISNTSVSKGSFVIPSESRVHLNRLNLKISPLTSSNIQISQLAEVKMPSIAIVESWFHDMDAGWTRYVFDTYNIPYKVLRPDELAETNLSKNFQVIIFPNQNSDLLTTGKRKRDDDYWPMNLAPEFSIGMEKKGKQNLLKFIDGGGKVLSWGQSVELFMGVLEIELDKGKKDEFTLPVSNVRSSLVKNGLEAIGCHLQVNSLKGSPLTYGMPRSFPIFFNNNPVFETSIPYFDTDRRVILLYPESDPRLSGYIKKGEILENKAAMVWVKKNKGHLILYGFNPQFRGQTSGNFKLIFNALLME
jgi:hypothetical protein